MPVADRRVTQPSPVIAIAAAHLVLVVAFFRRPLLLGEVPYFRDLASHYYPSFVLLERAAAEGVGWPLWDRYSNAGEPFLEPYLPSLTTVRLFGALWALRLDAPLHVWIAAFGASVLARRRGAQPLGCWAAGAFYGLGGFVLSCSNSLQLFHGVCWAPLVLTSFLACLESATGRRVAALAMAAAIQVSTLAADVVVLTAISAPFLWPRRPRWRDLPPLILAGMIALLLAAPTLLGVGWLLEGTRRSRGFSAEEALDYSASPAVLAEAVLPRFFGDVHTFSDFGYWGQSFFDGGYPYIVSLYVGPCVILLAVLGARGPGSRRLLLLLLLGVLLALGRYGPLSPVLTFLLRHFRYPVKYFFLAHLAVCLLAARGIDEAQRRRLGWIRYAPAALLLAAAAAIGRDPHLPARVLGGLVPALADWRALIVASMAWPLDLLRTGALAAGLGLALALPRWRGALAGGFAALDLAWVNTPCHPTTHPAFYELRPEMRAALDYTARHGADRWFAFGVSASPGTRFHPDLAATNSDVWLYYADRQTLWGSAHILDGLEAAFQEEQSFAPDHATLTIEERRPARFHEFAARLRLANVRWIASPTELPEDMATPVMSVSLPILAKPLRVYELPGAVPRVSWVGAIETASGEAYWTRARRVDFDPTRTALVQAPAPPVPPVRGAVAAPTVSWERPDPHTIRLRVATPPGLLVVVEGYRADWHATTESRATLPIVRANGRYMGVVTPGGEHVVTLRLEPRWRPWALAACVMGALLVVGLFLRRSRPGQRTVDQRLSLT